MQKDQPQPKTPANHPSPQPRSPVTKSKKKSRGPTKTKSKISAVENTTTKSRSKVSQKQPIPSDSNSPGPSARTRSHTQRALKSTNLEPMPSVNPPKQPAQKELPTETRMLTEQMQIQGRKAAGRHYPNGGSRDPAILVRVVS